MRTVPTLAIDLRAVVGQLTGIGVYTKSLTIELARRGRFRLLGLAHREPEDGAWLREHGIAFEAQPAPSGVLWQQLTLPRRLARGDVDLFWSPLQTLPLRSPVPAVTTVHDLTALILPGTHRFKVRWSQLPFLGRSLARARRIVAISEATARDLDRYYPECRSRVRVVHNGVDPEFRPAAPAEVAAIREAEGMPGGWVLYAGTLEPRKNVDLLLDAWETLRREDDEVPPLVLAGPYGWKSRSLMRRLEARTDGELRCLGHVSRPRLVRLMQAARVFVFPSLYEGFGLPVAEAMACGVPVVATTGSSLPEVVGDAGLLVRPGDAGALGGAVLHLLADPATAQRLGEAGRERAGRFRWDTAAACYEETFLAALAEEHVP
jgi:glycosyltransferase involved in cell wall biosynthesis